MTRDHREPNGVSVLAAAPVLAGEPAVLAMCDHLVTPALYARLAATGTGGGATLGIDRRIGHPWVDPDDVTWVKTDGDAIVAIGNAPTALFHLLTMLEDPACPRPAAIIGCPVGFVGAVESKDALWTAQPVPCVIVEGRLGGSAITVAAVNALASAAE